MHYSKVLNALGYFIRNENKKLAEGLKSLKADWRRLDPSSEDPLGYISRKGKVGSPLGDPVSARALAYAWFYGDLVHADHIPERVREHDINARYQAGTLLITNIAVRVICTLNLLRVAKKVDLVPIPDEAFKGSVLARSSFELPLVRFVMAPVDTPSEEMERFLDAQPYDVHDIDSDSETGPGSG